MLNKNFPLPLGVLPTIGALLLGATPALAQAFDPDAPRPTPAVVVPEPPAAVPAPSASPQFAGQSADSAAPAPRPGGQVDRGFVLRASLGGKVSLLALSGSSGVPSATSGLQAGLFAGGKLGRVIAGLNLDFTNFTFSNTGSSSTSVSSILLTPELMVALLRSADQRVELIADFGLGLGALFGGVSGSSNSTTIQLGYQLAPGVRFWTHPHFAIQGLAGFGGQAFFVSGAGGSAGTSSIHGIFASVGLLGAI